MAIPDKLTYGSYEVLQNPDGSPCLLGTGSFGATYKARHVLLGRITALKVIREDKLSRDSKEQQEETKRFLGEARAVGKLHHPGIAVVHDCALDNGVFYYAMEYCDGGSLQKWCDNHGPMPWPQVREIALQVASALDYAHASGFLHRDIKPANIMLHGEGATRQAKIIDFGLAQKLALNSESSTATATVRNDQENFRGTYATASPEQILEEPLDPRSDLFSFGVTLWWLLIGRNPFSEMKRGRMIADRTGPASYAAALPADLDPEARSLLEGLLEKDVARRTASALVVVERLDPEAAEAAGAAPAVAAPVVAAPAVAAPIVAGVAASPAMEVKPLPCPPDLEDGYAIGGAVVAASQAKLYAGESLTNRQPVVVIIPDASLDADARGGMRVAASRKLDFGVYAFLDWRFSAGDDVFVISKPGGCSLMGLLRKFGPAKFADVLPLLSQLARCFDASQAWTGFGIQVEPGEILVSTRDGSADINHFQSWSDLDPQATRCLPLFVTEGEHVASSEATLSTSSQEFPPLAQFAALVYRVLSGSAVRYASFFTTSGYVMASGLSEDGNALLAATICAPDTQPSACRFIRALAGLESLPVSGITALLDPPSAHDLGTGKLVPTGAVVRAKVVAAAKPAAADRPQSAAAKAAELERQLAMARQAAEKDARKDLAKDQRKQEEAKRKTDEEAARQQQAAARQAADQEARRRQDEARRAAAAQQPAAAVPPPPPQAGPLPGTGASRGGRKMLAIAAGVGVLVVIIAGVAIMTRGSKRETVEAKQPADPKPPEDTRPKDDPPPADNPKPTTDREPPADNPPNSSTEPMATVKVPGDAKSVEEALKRCKDGGTIEIGGGTHTKAIHLTKSVSLVATTSAVFDSRELTSNLIVASGQIEVTLRNIQIKNTLSEVKATPALVLIKNGASIHFDGCVIEKSNGDGVALADQASARFSHSPVRNNHGNGIKVSGASKLDISLSEVRENGLSGIVLENAGSIAKLGSGTKIEANSKSGVEVGKGAVIQCSGVTIDGNGKVGLVVDGSGSQARLESSCVISNNKKFGVSVSQAGRVVMTDSTVEENLENGLYAASGAQVDITSCHFKSNGKVGVGLLDQSTRITIAKTDFTAHAELAAAFEQGTATVTDCTFADNTAAIYFGQGARGAATGNTISPGPLDKTLILEEAGEVKLDRNTIGGSR